MSKSKTLMEQLGITKEELYEHYTNCYHHSLDKCGFIGHRWKYCQFNSERQKFCKYYYLRHRYWENWWRMLWKLFGKIPFFIKLKPELDQLEIIREERRIERERRKIEEFKEYIKTHTKKEVLYNYLEVMKCYKCKKNLYYLVTHLNEEQKGKWLDYFYSVITGEYQDPTSERVDIAFLCCDCMILELDTVIKKTGLTIF